MPVFVRVDKGRPLMSTNDTHILPSPETKAGVLSQITHSWLTDLLRKGYKTPLDPTDLYELDEAYHTVNVGSQLEVKWNVRKDQGSWPLFWAVSDAFGRPFYWSGFLKLGGDVAGMASPYILKLLINNMESLVIQNYSGSNTIITGYILCGAIFLLQVLNTLLVNYYFTVNFRAGLKIRTALNSAVYQKALKLSGASRLEFSTGQMVNLVSNDSSRIENSVMFLHYIWSGPFQIIVILLILYKLIGVSVFIGLLIFGLAIPIQGKITTWLSTYRKVISKPSIFMSLTFVGNLSDIR